MRDMPFFGKPEGMSPEDWQQLRDLWAKASAESARDLTAKVEEAWGGAVVLDAGSVFVGMAIAWLQTQGLNFVALLEMSEEDAAHFAKSVDMVRGVVPAEGVEPEAPKPENVALSYRRALLDVYRMIAAPGVVSAEVAERVRNRIQTSLYPPAEVDEQS